jgi:uncharacterized membrane protein YgcG
MVADRRAAAEADSDGLPLVVCLLLAVLAFLYAIERPKRMSIPPRPTEWVTDISGVLSPGFVQQQRNKLDGWHEDTGHRLLVYVTPTIGDPALSYDAYTRVLFDSWGVGRVPQNDGVVLFVFTADDMRWIRVGWGLMDALPDSEVTRICVEVIKPLIHQNEWDQAIGEGVGAITTAIDLWDEKHGQ